MRCRCSGKPSAPRASSPCFGQSTRETTLSVAVPRTCCGASYAQTRQGEKGRGTRCYFCTTPTDKLRTHCRRSSTTTRDPAGNSRTWASCWLTSRVDLRFKAIYRERKQRADKLKSGQADSVCKEIQPPCKLISYDPLGGSTGCVGRPLLIAWRGNKVAEKGPDITLLGDELSPTKMLCCSRSCIRGGGSDAFLSSVSPRKDVWHEKNRLVIRYGGLSRTAPVWRLGQCRSRSQGSYQQAQYCLHPGRRYAQRRPEVHAENPLCAEGQGHELQGRLRLQPPVLPLQGYHYARPVCS